VKARPISSFLRDETRAQRLFALRNVELDDVGQRHLVGEDDARALFGQIADQAGERAALAADIDEAAQKAFAPSGIAAFAHLTKNPSPALARMRLSRPD
jgi:hypothetical protein